jgi:Rrf2 family protein
MNVPSKTHYALRILVDLALYATREPVQVAAMAKRQEIPKQFLHQILLGLKSCGMVRSTRGRQGGYALAMPADGINLASVVRATQGSLLALPQEADTAKNNVDAAVCEAWEMIRCEVQKNLESLTVSDLCKRAVEKKARAADYVI